MRKMEIQALGLLSLFGISLRSTLAIRSEFFIAGFALLVRVTLVVLVWRAAYGSRTEMAAVSRSDAVSYAVLGAIYTHALNPYFRSTLAIRLRRGQIAADLLRPIGLIPQTLAQQLAVVAASLPRCALATSLVVTLGALQAPSGGFGGVVLLCVSTFFGTVIALLANLLVSMTAFWTMEASGALIVYNVVAQFASGGLIPLWFMPDGLREALTWLPFQAQVFTPLAIYLGTVSKVDALSSIAIQVGWIAALGVAARLIWALALRRVVVQGG